MGQLIAGPFAGQMLAAFGADVVKIEPPGRGDPLRTWRVLDDHGTSYWWRSIARNKRSLTLDLSKPEGQDYSALVGLQKRCPDRKFSTRSHGGMGSRAGSFSKGCILHFVYTRVSGYGQTGPYASRPGFASACEGVAGLRYVNGYPGERPVRLNLSLGDSLAGMHAVIGTLLALIARQPTTHGGQGQVVDVSIVESVFNMMEGVFPEYDGAGVVREPSGSTVTGIVPTNTYQCADGLYVVIGGNGDSIFQRLMTVAGRADLADDPRLSNNIGRVSHEAEIDAALAAWTASQNLAAVLRALETADVPAGPVNSIADIAADPHFQARDNFELVTVRKETRRLPAVHPRLLDTPAETHWAGA